MTALLYGLAVAGAIVIGSLGATISLYVVLSDAPIGWPIRAGGLIAYFWLSHSTMMLAHDSGTGLREQDERDKVERQDAAKLAAAERMGRA